MIELDDITKSFPLAGGTIRVLKGISIYIAQGEFVSIMGPSGSGKSTLSSILGCLARPTSGKYKIDGEDVAKLSARKLAKLRNQKIGFIFQDFNLLPGIPAYENVALPLFYGGIGPKERKERAICCLEKVGLGEKVRHTPSQLSGGQKQRVAIARALVNDPVFLFADEPTGALDKRTGHEIMGLMQKLNMMGHTVVQVTHNPIDANFSKRILSLVDGCIITDAVVDSPTLGSFSQPDESQSHELVNRLWQVAQNFSTDVQTHFDSIQRLYTKVEKQAAGPSLVQAVKALVRWENESADEKLKTLFKHKEWVVRAEVLQTGVSRGMDYAIPFCFEGLQDENGWVRYVALTGIRSFRKLQMTPEQKKAILVVLEDGDERVRATAVAMVGFWKDPSTIPNLMAATEDGIGRVRANAIDALSKFLSDSQRQSEIVAVLEKHLEDRNNRARGNAAFALFPFKEKMAVDTLTKMLTSDNNLMRASAAWAFGAIPSGIGADLLLGSLREEKDEMTLNQVIRALARLSDKYFPFEKQVEKILS